MHSKAIDHLARLAWGHLLGAEHRFCRDRIRALLAPIVGVELVDRWLGDVEIARVEAPDTAAVESVQQTLDDNFRRTQGVYLTPSALADGMAAAVQADAGEAVVDLSAGAGTLLRAAIERHPHARGVGVEKEPLLAIAAAINLASVRLGQGTQPGRGDQVFVGDGLSRDPRWEELEGSAAAVLGNPPYVREKGNRELFASLRAEHDHLSEFFGARMDLQYLFFHRSASLVRPGGRLVMLTTAYWLTATNADRVREDMAGRLTPELLVRVDEAGVFADAPGQHSLVSVFRRDKTLDQPVRAVSLDDEPASWAGLIEDALGRDCTQADVREHSPADFGAKRWSPFADGVTTAWARQLEREGTALSVLSSDRQGFVSGADRFSARHPKRYAEDQTLPEAGEPIFLFRRQQIPETLAKLEGTVLRPVLRASSLRANQTIITAPTDELALYIDAEVSARGEALLEEHLGRFRPVLEHRREVRKGSMPWYRLHWPRDRAEQTAPKLVVPRRAPAPCFALDLSACAISSDCTYLVAPSSVADPVRYLVKMMVVLNSDLVARYLRHFGKSKGRQLEFYSEPLRTLPLPLRPVDGGLEVIEQLVDPGTRARWDILANEQIERIFGCS